MSDAHPKVLHFRFLLVVVSAWRTTINDGERWHDRFLGLHGSFSKKGRHSVFSLDLLLSLWLHPQPSTGRALSPLFSSFIAVCVCAFVCVRVSDRVRVCAEKQRERERERHNPRRNSTRLRKPSSIKTGTDRERGIVAPHLLSLCVYLCAYLQVQHTLQCAVTDKVHHCNATQRRSLNLALHPHRHTVQHTVRLLRGGCECRE